MPAYEYKVIPAPNRAERIKGVKGTAARFAHGLEVLMNGAGEEGWEYLRADMLPCKGRQGLRAGVAVDRHVLVFRREKQSGDDTGLVTDPVASAPRVDGVATGAVAGVDEGDSDADADAGHVARLGPALRHPEERPAED